MAIPRWARRRQVRLLFAAGIVVASTALAAQGCGEAPEVTTTSATEVNIPLGYVYGSDAAYVHEATTIATSTVDAALMTGGEGSVTTQETTKERHTAAVQQVMSDGEATLAVTFETLESTTDGVPQDSGAPRQATITVDTTGRVISVASDDGGTAVSDSAGFAELLQYLDTGYDLTAVLYPASGTATIGEEWSGSYSIPLPGMRKELTLTATGKLLSVSTQDGRRLAVIEHSSTLPVQVTLDLSEYFRSMLEGSSYVGDIASVVVKMAMDGEITYAGTSTVDLATGQIVTAQGQSTMTVTLTYTEAPETLIPSDQRGPFSMDAVGEVVITAIE